MADQSKLYMGIDIGSVSLNIAILDENLRLLASVYERTNGQPIPLLIGILDQLKKDFAHVDGAISTGSARNLISDILGIDRENEIITQAKAVAYFHPEVRTVIEIGGQDSKLIFMEVDGRDGKPVIVDHALNEICAAGTGSFLDQQAQRLGISIEDEFGDLVVKSRRPATIAGRCSVFAKSDMIHLQQEGTPTEDILAGLCYALARNYISNLGKGRRFEKPIAFQGGVAANKGVIKALGDLLQLEPGELIVPQHFKIMGAIGSAITAMERTSGVSLNLDKAIEDLRRYLAERPDEVKSSHLKRLIDRGKGNCLVVDNTCVPEVEGKKKAYLGIDVGASSINVVVLDEDKNLLAKRYLLKEGEPIETVKRALEEVGQEMRGLVEIEGVGVTGSGRRFVGDFVGADLVINEITAQARATLDLDGTVDTIIEIGGQDSKYIYLRNGVIVDFEMNKVCAAGTGAFLQEQADRLNVSIEEEFSDYAFRSDAPVDLGTRCTVFMESDLIHHQQIGARKGDLLAGLSYSVANNFIEKVVGNKKIGQKVYFQGGVAGNGSVVVAFENILGRDVAVPENYNVTGAIGAALIVMEKRRESSRESNFAGFCLKDRAYEVESFQCHHCSNQCEIKKVSIGGEFRSFYGGICDRYENASWASASIGRKQGALYHYDTSAGKPPDLFAEREEMLMRYYKEDEAGEDSPVIGIPRILMFYEQFPLWAAFFGKLGLKVMLSDKSSSKLIHRGLQEVLAETCYPVKVAYGHMVNLIEKGVDSVFLPSVIDLEKDRDDVNRSYNCPYIQAIPFMMKAAFENRSRIISPTIFMAKEKRNLEAQMMEIGLGFGKRKKEIAAAIADALRAQEEFETARLKRGREVLEGLGENDQGVMVIGKPYNVHDTGLNLNISKKLRKLGMLAIPYDLLPLDAAELPAWYSNLVWKNEQNLLRSSIIAKNNGRLHPVMITNYGCGPDAFFAKYLEDSMGDDPYLVLEVDEHSGDAGMVTRLEAFLDTIDRPKREALEEGHDDLNVVRPRRVISIFKPSKKIKELDRILYISYVSGHSDVWAAAFQSVGIDARVMPKPDEMSEELGRKYVSSKECHPYLVTTGDMVKMVQSRDFDPDRSAFVMLNFDGSCRLSQYSLSQKLVLKRLGLSHVPVIAPITSIRHDEATRMFGNRWAMNVWNGWLATDVLTKKLLHIRPYEVNNGETERVYEKAIQDISAAILKGGFREALKRSVAVMDTVPVRRESRPIVGIVGEFYSCMNSWANNDIIKVMESLGAEVRYGPSTTDYLVYFNELYPGVHFSRGEYLASVYFWLRRFWFMGRKGEIEGMLGQDIYDHSRVPKVAERVRTASPYVTDDIDPVVTVNMSKAENYALEGCSGIANLIVLNCLYGTLSTAIYKKLQRDRNRIPMLTIIYEGLKPTNEQTRIEAFIHQAKLFRERYCLA
ncbi:MAG: CoA activase [Chloroflexi bacterium]|nr:CoA activase [Chloroflexota bacterium]